MSLKNRPPAALLIAAGLGIAFVVVPLIGLLQRAEWSNMSRQLTSDEVLQALGLSLICSFAAALVGTILGVPLAWVLARLSFPGRSIIRALAILPMVLPPVVGGVALLQAFGRQGFLGRYLGGLPGFPLPFTTAGVILAETFVAMPFVVMTVEAGFRQTDLGFEEAAASLGANPWRRFRTITAPLAATSIAAGAALCWARALGEFGATITFAGNLPGRTETMPTAVYTLLQTNPGAAISLSVLLLAISLGVLVGLRDSWIRPR
ncbi:MAG: ABC transporter permease [Actinomycetota bacterium]